MNTDINLNTSFTFAPKVLIVQLQAGLLTHPPFDLPSHAPRRTVAMKYQKFYAMSADLQQWGLFRILTGFPLRMQLKKQLHQPNLHYKITKRIYISAKSPEYLYTIKKHYTIFFLEWRFLICLVAETFK